MIFIYENLSDLFKVWDKLDKDTVDMMILPSNNASKKIAFTLDKREIEFLSDSSIRVFEKKKNNHGLSLFKDLDHDLYSKPDTGDGERLSRKIKESLENKKDVYMDINAFVFFILWSSENYTEFNSDIYFEGNFDLIRNGFKDYIAFDYKLDNFSKILKLLCFFYHKELGSELMQMIGKVQEEFNSNIVVENNIVFLRAEITDKLKDIDERIYINKAMSYFNRLLINIDYGISAEDELIEYFDNLFYKNL